MITNLPTEILFRIIEYITLDEFSTVFSLNKEFYEISKREELWEDLCKVYHINLSFKTPDLTFRQFFKRSYLPRILIVHAEPIEFDVIRKKVGEVFLGFMTNEAMKQKLLKERFSDCNLSSRGNISRIETSRKRKDKEVLAEILGKTDIVVVYGGSYFESVSSEQLGDLLHEFVNNGNKSVVTMLATHGDGKMRWMIGGKWRDMKMNPLVVKGSTSYSNRLIGSTLCRYDKDGHESPDWSQYGISLPCSVVKNRKVHLYGGSSEIGFQTKRNKLWGEGDKVARILMNFEAKSGVFITHAVAERLDVKHLQLNFQLNASMLDVTVKLLKYIHFRKKCLKN